MDCCDGEKESKEMKPKNSTKNSNFLPWLILGVATILAVAAGFVISSKSAPASLAPSNAKAVVEQSSYDWGDIDINGGKAVYQFTVENQGTDDLKLTSIKTSCACTTAQVIIDGVKSPYFGMHTSSSWIGAVKPGETAVVEVVFDPLFHGPTGTGPVERLISIETNDAQNSALELILTGNVIKK